MRSRWIRDPIAEARCRLFNSLPKYPSFPTISKLGLGFFSLGWTVLFAFSAWWGHTASKEWGLARLLAYGAGYVACVCMLHAWRRRPWQVRAFGAVWRIEGWEWGCSVSCGEEKEGKGGGV